MVCDFGFQVGEIPFKRSDLYGLEVNESRLSGDDENVHAVRRPMDNPLCFVELRKGHSARVQRLQQKLTVFDLEFGNKVRIVQGADGISDLDAEGWRRNH